MFNVSVVPQNYRSMFWRVPSGLLPSYFGISCPECHSTCTTLGGRENEMLSSGSHRGSVISQALVNEGSACVFCLLQGSGRKEMNDSSGNLSITCSP